MSDSAKGINDKTLNWDTFTTRLYRSDSGAYLKNKKLNYHHVH